MCPATKRGTKANTVCASPRKAGNDSKRKSKSSPERPVRYSLVERITRLNHLMYGWVNYFKHATGYQKFKRLDSWIRSRLRYCIWKDWKRPKRRLRAFLQLGVEPSWAKRYAYSRKGGWRIVNSQIMKMTVTEDRLRQRGYIPFLEYYLKVKHQKSSKSPTKKRK